MQSSKLPVRMWLYAMQKLTSIVFDTLQLSTFLECQSMTATKYTNPLDIGI